MMKVAVCCIGRSENRYIREYVEHYKNIGVDKIFIYDNNYDGEEYFEDVINDYISQGIVDIINYRNRTICQLSAYQDCYDRYGKEYDWILFIDCGDEYLYMEGFTNIKAFLNQEKFNNYEIIHINLLTYGDNNLVIYDGKKLCERFTEPIKPLNFTKSYSFPENDHISSIVRGKLPKVVWNSTPHTPSNALRCCDAAGKPQQSTSPFIHPYDFTFAHFKHYTTKTIQEYLGVKSMRGYPDANKDFFKKSDVVNAFFSNNNEHTEEKDAFLKNKKAYGIIKFAIVNYNTQKLTDACINSIKKHMFNPQIFVFDNSDKEPFNNTHDNVTVFDNTKGQYIDFNKWLSEHPKSKQSNAKVNNWGSAKHCYSIEKLCELINDNFILMDSDVLLKRDVTELCDESCIYVGEDYPKLVFWYERVLPYILYINVKMCKEKGIHFYDEKRMHGLCGKEKNDNYDTGSSFYFDCKDINHRSIKCDDYIVHLKAGSWEKHDNEDEWLEKWAYLYKDGVKKDYNITNKPLTPINTPKFQPTINVNYSRPNLTNRPDGTGRIVKKRILF